MSNATTTKENKASKVETKVVGEIKAKKERPTVTCLSAAKRYLEQAIKNEAKAPTLTPEQLTFVQQAVATIIATRATIGPTKKAKQTPAVLLTKVNPNPK